MRAEVRGRGLIVYEKEREDLLREAVLFHIHTLLALGLMAVLYGIHKAVEEKVG